ncbi:hypothetical protein B0H16DRAFT_1517104 [Mycena metata]|uniref:Uncharacterized protein n=1 Tax=Mycena metata TaxID=1033252 RepID=A0AAD7NPT0_9AGAR|nr:hypothetical protein B0H16DRAFT_1517104 [Mycena metata]
MSTYSYTSSYTQRQRPVLGSRGIEAEYAAAAAYGEPALSDAASDAQIARALAESKTSRAMGYASHSSSASTLLGSAVGSGSDSGSSTSGSRAASLYSYGSGANSNYSYGGGLPQRHIPSPAYPGHSPVPTPAHSASRVPLPSSHGSTYSAAFTPRQLQSPYAGGGSVRYGGPPTPTPRYAADELLARNLAQEWRVASVQGEVLADPQYARSAPSTPASAAPRNVHFTPPGSARSAHGPPLVVRASSPTPSAASTRSSWSYHAPSSPSPHRASSHQSSRPPSIAHSRSHSASASTPIASARGTPTPSRPLSPLDVDDDFYLRTPSVRSAASSTSSTSSAASIRSASSIRSAGSARSGSIRSTSAASMRSASSAGTARSHRSTQSLLVSLTRSARHAPLHAAAAQARELHRTSSRASSKAGSARLTTPNASKAGSVRYGTSSNAHSHSASSTGGEASNGSLTLDERGALARLHALATAPTRCAHPACGAMIPGVLRGVWDGILFPSPPSVDLVPSKPPPFPLSPSSSNTSLPPPKPPPPTPIPIPQSLTAALHARCAACSTTHCRGCGLAVACSGGPACGLPSSANGPNPSSTYSHCPLPTHCPPARALGALAALCAFDRAVSSSASASPGRETDKALLGPLRALIYFLAPPPPGLRTPRASLDMPGGMLFSVPEEEPEGGEEGGGDGETEMDAALPVLLLLSRVPGYVAGLLRAGVPIPPSSPSPSSGYGYGGATAMPNVDVGTWMARAPAYGAVLRLLRAVGDAGGGSRVLVRPIMSFGMESGGQVEKWLRSARGETSATRHLNRHAVEGGGETLLALIRRLEPARAALLRLAGATSFGPTVEKAHALCDAVLYVLLQDVLGEGES